MDPKALIPIVVELVSLLLRSLGGRDRAQFAAAILARIEGEAQSRLNERRRR